MAIFNSKFLEIKNPLLVPLIITTSFLLPLNIKVVKSEDISFDILNFFVDDSINLAGDASFANGNLALTNKDANGNPTQYSVGVATYSQTLHLNDKANGRFAHFTTDFNFVLDGKRSNAYGDGFTFFLASPDFQFPPTRESSGGFFGLFTYETAFDPSKNDPIVAIEFDTVSNPWENNTQRPHIGYDVNSLNSVATVGWSSESEVERGLWGHGHINYDSVNKVLSVFVKYPVDERGAPGDVSFEYPLDLSSILPEQVVIGFSAGTGENVETHEILNWSWLSSL